MIKKIGIIGAMEEEVEALRGKLTYVKTTSRASMDFYAGKMGNKEVVIVRSGIGKVNAGICTQILADLFQVDAVINTCLLYTSCRPHPDWKLEMFIGQ